MVTVGGQRISISEASSLMSTNTGQIVSLFFAALGSRFALSVRFVRHPHSETDDVLESGEPNSDRLHFGSYLSKPARRPALCCGWLGYGFRGRLASFCFFVELGR